MTDTNPITPSFKVEMNGTTVTVTDTSIAAPGTSIEAVSFTWSDGPATECAPLGSVDHDYPNGSQRKITQTVTGATTVVATSQQFVHPKYAPPTSVPPVAVSPPPPPPPPPQPPPPIPSGYAPIEPPASSKAGQAVHLIAVIAGQAFTLDLVPGVRKPIGPTQEYGSVVYHGDGLSVVLENGYPGQSHDLSGHFALTTADGTQLFDGDLTIAVNRTSRPFWLQRLQLRPNIDLSLFPNLGPGAEDCSMYDVYMQADNSPCGCGPDAQGMQSAGEAPHLGYVSLWDACWLKNPTANNLAVVRGWADSLTARAHCAIDWTTQKIIRATDASFISTVKDQRGNNGNPFVPYTTANVLTLDRAHLPQAYALACELFGTDCDREKITMWSNYWNSLEAVPSTRTDSGMWTGGAIRGLGRGLYHLVLAWKYGLDDWKPTFEAWINEFREWNESFVFEQVGIPVDQRQSGQGYPNDEYAAWQQDIWSIGIGLAICAGFTQWQTMFDYFAVGTWQRIEQQQHEFADYPHVAWRRAQQTSETTDILTACETLIAHDSADMASYNSYLLWYAAVMPYIKATFPKPSLQRWALLNYIDAAARKAIGIGGWTDFHTNLGPTLRADAPKWWVPVDDYLDGFAAQSLYDAPLALAITYPENDIRIQQTVPYYKNGLAGDYYSPIGQDSYVMQSQAVFAMFCDLATDKVRARAAYDKFQKWNRVQITTNPKYNIVPRAA